MEELFSPITFEDLNLDNWKNYRKFVLNSELTFHKNIRSNEGEILEELGLEETIARIIKFDEKYAGNIVGVNGHSLGLIPPEEISLIGKNTIYVSNIVIDEVYRRRGLGKKLIMDFICEAKKQGYEFVVGHFRNNYSLHLMLNLGAMSSRVENNWSDTGEKYTFCFLKI